MWGREGEQGGIQECGPTTGSKTLSCTQLRSLAVSSLARPWGPAALRWIRWTRENPGSPSCHEGAGSQTVWAPPRGCGSSPPSGHWHNTHQVQMATSTASDSQAQMAPANCFPGTFIHSFIERRFSEQLPRGGRVSSHLGHIGKQQRRKKYLCFMECVVQRGGGGAGADNKQ